MLNFVSWLLRTFYLNTVVWSILSWPRNHLLVINNSTQGHTQLLPFTCHLIILWPLSKRAKVGLPLWSTQNKGELVRTWTWCERFPGAPACDTRRFCFLSEFFCGTLPYYPNWLWQQLLRLLVSWWGSQVGCLLGQRWQTITGKFLLFMGA